MLIIVIIAHLNILQYSDGIVGKGSQREVFGKQVWGHTKLVESHQSCTQRWCNLARDTTLMQSDNTLILLANTYQDNLCSTNATTCQVLTFNLNLIRWNDGHTTPQDDSSAKQVGGYRWYATPCALTLKGSNSTRMSDEESGLLPD